jgi:hypothetical protein
LEEIVGKTNETFCGAAEGSEQYKQENRGAIDIFVNYTTLYDPQDYFQTSCCKN